MLPTLADLYTASDSDPAPIVAFLRRLAAEYALPQPLHVLDAGCGPGRLLGPLERLRWQVTGMEPNPDFLAAARDAAGSSRRVAVRRGGFLDLDEDAEFDLAAAVNSSFAHLLSPDERAAALRRLFRALRPGGVVLLDLPNFLWILRNYRAPEPYTFTARGVEVTLRRAHEIDYGEATFTTTDEYLLAGDGRTLARLVHAYGIATLPEIRRELAGAGFAEPRAFGGYHPTEGGRLDGPRLLVAARRPHA